MKLTESFRCAFSGLWYCIRKERNFRIHLCAAALVLVTGYFAGFDGRDVATLLVTISLVLFAEIANTAIEKAVDLIMPQYHKVAKYAKDLAAGAVLVCALLSVGTACALFLRREIWGHLWSRFAELPWLIPFYLTLFALCAIFVLFGGERDGDHKSGLYRACRAAQCGQKHADEPAGGAEGGDCLAKTADDPRPGDGCIK